MNTEAFEKFERLRKKVERVEAETEALQELQTGLPSARVEAPAGGRDESVDAELAELKKKLG